MYFALLDKDNIVVTVIVADQSYIDELLVDAENSKIKAQKNLDDNNKEDYIEYLEKVLEDASVIPKWIETSIDGSSRKNFAGVGYTYDEGKDAFIPPKPGPDYVFDEDTCRWVDPNE